MKFGFCAFSSGEVWIENLRERGRGTEQEKEREIGKEVMHFL